ncbi:carboxypeptidase C [Massospora cicadina]|nr:carboxypeptidase C [Massospora cicadina]
MATLLKLLALGSVVAGNLCGNVTQRSGYLNGSELFYWFFESKTEPTRAPLILFLSGGPGFASSASIFMGNGPCGLDLSDNVNSWNRFANLLYLDQDASEKVVEFLNQFFLEYPIYLSHEFHILSESYGGHFAPSIAALIHSQNAHRENPIRLHSIAIASPFNDPKSQFQTQVHSVCQTNRLPVEACDEMRKSSHRCQDKIQRCKDASTCRAAYETCDDGLVKPYLNAGNDMYSLSPTLNATKNIATVAAKVESILNSPQIQKKLGATGNFRVFNPTVFQKFVHSGDFMTSFKPQLAYLLANKVRVLLYAGTLDYYCNAYGVTELATNLVPELGGIGWNASGGSDAIILSKSHLNLQVSKVHNASHWISLDFPSHVYDLIHAWITLT